MVPRADLREWKSRIGIRLQAIVTNLVFEHALRIRIKAGTTEVDDSGSSDRPATAETIESQDVALQQEDASEDADTPNAATKGKAKSTSHNGPTVGDAKVKRPEQTDEGAGSAHLTGRINNLVSGDLRSINDLGMIAIYFGASSRCKR